jgi:hypothetical protein
MENKITLVEDKILIVRGQQVLLDRDVASLYGVETREINKAVRNNPDKFPDGYCFRLQQTEKQYVVENFHRLENLKFSTIEPRAFTEKGLYMLATVLKSPEAVEVTFAIIETFAKLRELARSIERLNTEDIPVIEAKTLKAKVTQMFKDVFTDPLPVKMQKVLVSVNFGILKITVETVSEREK